MTVNDALIVAWLATLMTVQVAWCVFYAAAYRWRETPLGPVWLTKGVALAIFWTFMLANQFAEVPDAVWAWFVGPLLTVGTFGWLYVTVQTRRRHGTGNPQP